MSTLENAVTAIRAGNKAEGRQILEQILETEEDNEDVWLWLSSVVDTDEDREICLENVLALNPDNVVAKRGLEALRSGTFNVHDITGEVIETEELKDPFADTTFHDQFFDSLDEPSDEDDDELEWPSGMEGPEGKAEKAKKGRGLNLRLILLVVVGLFVVCALGSVAAYSLFNVGSVGGIFGEQQSQEVPVEGQQPPATPTNTSTPTATPTPTNTPFLLPTAKSTQPPTPTPTRVVSPTPAGGG